jgi:glycosyltransferase involved in cell wall biosynthesis
VISLLADPATYELIVVLDGPNRKCSRVLERLSRSNPRLRLAVVLAGGAGGASARQAGAELASGDVVLFIDDDVVAAPGLVSGHAAWHADGARRIVLGYMPIEPGSIRRRQDLMRTLYAEGYERACRCFEQAAETILLNFWAGNFSIARKEALRLGLFSPAFAGARHWDRDFGLRCRAAGLTPVFDRSLLARHEYRRSWSQFVAESRQQGLGYLLVHTRHSDAVGEVALADFEPPGPRTRRIIRAARRPRLRPVIQAALAITAYAYAARRPTLGHKVARIARAIGSQQGAIEGSTKLAGRA